VLSPLRFGSLERHEHRIEALLVGAGQRPRQDAGAGHHAGLDVLRAGHPLFEDEASLH
jgi:hypothetical protein